MRRTALLIAALLLAAGPARPDPSFRRRSPEGSKELQIRADLREESAELLRYKEYAELDKLAERYRKGERTPSGIWKLDQFYSGLRMGPERHRESLWEIHMDRFREWREERPDSTAALIGLANVWNEYAWDARGTGWASEVTETGWKLYRERLETANRILVENSKECSVCPRWHSLMIFMARARSWPRPAAWEFLKTSAETFPDYFGSYFQMVVYLQPRWGGRPGEMERMAAWAAENAGGDLGKELYARICWTIWDRESAKYFLQPATGIDWEKMKAGFEVILKKYPGSEWNRTAFCYFAWLFRDRAVVQELFPELDRRLLTRFWPNWKSVNETRAWLRQEVPAE